jgi:hypothetical protein
MSAFYGWALLNNDFMLLQLLSGTRKHLKAEKCVVMQEQGGRMSLWKIRPKCTYSPTHYLPKLKHKNNSWICKLAQKFGLLL